MAFTVFISGELGRGYSLHNYISLYGCGSKILKCWFRMRSAG